MHPSRNEAIIFILNQPNNISSRYSTVHEIQTKSVPTSLVGVIYYLAVSHAAQSCYKTLQVVQSITSVSGKHSHCTHF